MESEKKNNIVSDAYYLVDLFHEDKKDVTQLHVQKLMFLFEAYYMNKYNVDGLYECNYQAWNFGPVATPLYKRFRVFGKENVKLTGEERQIGNGISDEKKVTMEELYEAFKGYSATQLVNFTHSKDSPWYKAWNIKEYSIISKADMKEWIGNYIISG